MSVRQEFTWRAVGVALVAGIGVTLAAASAAPATASVQRSERASVAAAYASTIAPAIATPVKWTGSTAGCRAGTTSVASKQATLTFVNAVRQLAGLSPVKLSPSLTAKAQKAALVFKANSSGTSLFLSHDLRSNVKCYSSDAKTAASRANIAASSDGTVAGAKGILGYLDEPGSGNTAAGHRRWILEPSLGSIGAGSTSTTNALYVVGPTAKNYKNPDWVTWPTSGYFPTHLEPEGRWSVSGKQGVRYDFSRATVSVTDASGGHLSVKKYALANGMSYADTLVFQVGGVTRPVGSGTETYVVTVSGVKKSGRTAPVLRYEVDLFDATSASGTRR